jgi:hypothetical protein
MYPLNMIKQVSVSVPLPVPVPCRVEPSERDGEITCTYGKTHIFVLSADHFRDYILAQICTYMLHGLYVCGPYYLPAELNVGAGTGFPKWPLQNEIQ